jgi:hypothetical protein
MQRMPHYNVNFALICNYDSNLLQFQLFCYMTFSSLVSKDTLIPIDAITCTSDFEFLKKYYTNTSILLRSGLYPA